MKRYYLFVILVLYSCSFDPHEEFANKEAIGTVKQIYGMTTYEIELYADSTFYMPADILEFTFGTFKLLGNKMFFDTKGGQMLLDTEYDLDSNQLFSVHKRPKELLYLEWRK